MHSQMRYHKFILFVQRPYADMTCFAIKLSISVSKNETILPNPYGVWLVEKCSTTDSHYCMAVVLLCVRFPYSLILETAPR